MALFRTIPASATQMTDWTQLDDRVWSHPGAVVDLGCARWDWSGCFLGKKRVIGADPLGEPTPGAELFRGVVGPANGTALLAVSGWEGEGSTVVGAASVKQQSFPMLTWRSFCRQFRIDDIAVLKMNIEGSEFGLLHSISEPEFAKIDQIAVAFHPSMPIGMGTTMTSTIEHLRRLRYSHRVISVRAKWYLFTRNPA